VEFKRAESIVIQFREQDLIVHNFISQKTFTTNVLCAEILKVSNDWQEIDFYFSHLSQYTQASIAEAIVELCELHALVVKNSSLDLINENFKTNWKWGTMAGLYHFGIKYCKFSTDDEALTWYNLKKTEASPELYKKNEAYSNIVEARETPIENVDFYSVLKNRRSNRNFNGKSITKQQLANCLYCGLGITAFLEVPELGDLPLKMTPSGGARNPYEAYVYVLNVENMEAGAYHYSAFENTLGLITNSPLPAPRYFLGDQEWVDNAAAVIFLVANFQRTMWKYTHPNAYRVVLMEAGHIMQNMALAATAQKLISTSTAAISDDVAEHVFKIDPVTQSVNYALAVGVL
jgi:SagB-type dehydrogenase family enzyme